MTRQPSCIAVVGLGYVGLPLAIAFSRHIPTIGYDTDIDRVDELRQGYDRQGNFCSDELRETDFTATADPAKLSNAVVFIVAVPTPVDNARVPDLRPLRAASELVGSVLRNGRRTHSSAAIAPVIVFESTVYPGCTEEYCVPILERASGLRCGQDFKVGYSPERINPGDPEHPLEAVVKLVGAQDEDTSEYIAELYRRIVKAGVHVTPNIKTAEAAKVIENTQRDLNIALVNELARLFHQLGLDTGAVLRAASTKWNFLPFKPGLVGGHCIPVDPYYLTYKAHEVGYHPEVILAGRRINDSMARYVAQQTVRLLVQRGKAVRGARVLVLGATFKEDVPDIRNSLVLELVRELESWHITVSVHDPIMRPTSLRELGLSVLEASPFTQGTLYDGVVLAVPHRALREQPSSAYRGLLDPDGAIMVDIKGVYHGYGWNESVVYWSL